MSNTPCASAKTRRTHVETWVKSQWKNPAHPGQFSPEINTFIGGAGVASVIGGTGSDVYGFIKGYAGGSVIINGFKSTDTLAFGGYGADPILSQGVVNGSDLIILEDETKILLEGLDHKLTFSGNS